MVSGQTPKLVAVPGPDAPFEAIIEFADFTYDAYRLFAGEPQHLERILGPTFEAIQRTLTVPEWIGLDLARALLFYAQRLHYWSGGLDPEEPLRAIVAHIGEISGGQVEERHVNPRGEI